MTKTTALRMPVGRRRTAAIFAAVAIAVCGALLLLVWYSTIFAPTQSVEAFMLDWAKMDCKSTFSAICKSCSNPSMKTALWLWNNGTPLDLPPTWNKKLIALRPRGPPEASCAELVNCTCVRNGTVFYSLCS